MADKVDRLTANLRNTFFLKKNAQLTISMLGSYRQQLAPGAFDQSSDDVFGTMARDFDLNPYSYALNTSRTLRPYDNQGNLEYYTNNWAPFNILNETKNNYTNLRVQDIKLQADFQAPIVKDRLQYAFVGAIRYASSSNEHNVTENSNVAGAYRSAENTIIRDANIFLWRDPDNVTSPPTVVLPYGGIYFRNNNFLRNFYLRNSLTYKKTFGGKHEVDAFIGQEVRYITREESRFDGYGLDYGAGLIVNTDPRMLSKIIGQSATYFGLGTTRERTASFFSRLTYGYSGRYIFSFTGNMNASNTQGLQDNRVRWTPTFTLGGKWNVKEEAFMQNSAFINTLSLRATYGLTAIAGTASNALPIFRNALTSNRRDISDREIGIYIEELQNKDLTYEKQYEANLGLDLGILKNRVSLTADIYRRTGFDLFDYVRTSGLGGQGVKLMNNANMVTRGAELSLRTVNIKSGRFEWTSTLNFSNFKQEVTKVENKPSLMDACDNTGASFVGFPRNSIFSVKYAGLTDQGLPLYNIPDPDKTYGVDFQDTGSKIAAGDSQKSGLLTYLKYEGPSNANETISLQNTFTYKSWSLGCFILASGGNKIRLPA
ncbi:MAG: SusC/RagA family TonB-linked outer membrane protein, partial [Candidatus Nephrothrix sp. EaCA]